MLIYNMNFITFITSDDLNTLNAAQQKSPVKI